jgi:DNA-binding transcriptional ArsR family regulator
MQSSSLIENPAADDRLDQLFHALSDRTRRALLARLATGPAMVTELAEPFAMSLPAVSKHLKVLEHARLVVRSVDGRIHRCSFAAEPLREVERWLDHYRPFWEDTLDALARYVERGERDEHHRSKGES